VPFDVSSRVKLKPTTAHHFTGATLFDRIARVLCEAACLPRKELYESWEVARRVRRRFRGGRIVDLACGHGLVAHVLLLLDDTSEYALCIDRRIPPSARAVADVLARAWPRLDGRIRFEAGDIAAVRLTPDDLVVSSHACGALTDRVLDLAASARARVAVLPCCHDAKTCATGGLEGWLDPSLAIDVARAQTLASRGYRVMTQRIPEAITPKNRLLLGEPIA
jgi:SAM-dependent methyltransferase